MRRTLFGLANLLAICAAPLAFSQGPAASSAADQAWRAQFDEAKDEGSIEQFREAVKLAERFGETDVRLLETLYEAADLCAVEKVDEPECKDKVWVKRAVQVYPKVVRQDLHYADVLEKFGRSTSTDNATARYMFGAAITARASVLPMNDAKIASAFAGLAWAHFYDSEHEAARSLMNWAITQREYNGDPSPEFADLLRESAKLHQMAEEPGEAETDFARAIRVYERLWKPTDSKFVDALQSVFDEAKEYGGEEFLGSLADKIVDAQRARGGRSKEYANALRKRGEYLLGVEQVFQAKSSYEEACRVLAGIGSPADEADCLLELARATQRTADFPAAVKDLERALALRARISKPGDFAMLEVRTRLAVEYLRAKDDAKAEAAFEALRLDRYHLIQAAEEMSLIYESRGDLRLASEKTELVVASIEARNPNDIRLAQNMARLASLYQRQGRAADANRMSMASIQASIRAAGANAKKNQNNKELQRTGQVVLYIWFGSLLFAVGCSILYVVVQRRVDRKLDALTSVGAPPALPPSRPAAPQPYLASSMLVTSSMLAAGTATSFTEPVSATSYLSAIDLAPDTKLAPPSLPARIVLRAEGSALFALRAVNLLFSLLTLGIYSFWGKAKVRRYVIGQAEYDGDAFAFHGTGRELLFGWLRALPVLAFIFLFPNVLPLMWQSPYAIFAAQGAVVVAFVILWPVARIGAHRYRLNRMSWRGLRFSFRGSTWRYLWVSLGGGLLTAITLGLCAPIVENWQNTLLTRDVYFGDSRFEFTGKGRALFWAGLLAIPLAFCTVGVGWAWWSALRQRYYWANTLFAGRRFECSVTGGALLALWLSNFFIALFTLGLGLSWVTLRTLRFWTEHVRLAGAPELAGVRSDPQAASAMGESFADFLGFDFGF